jgi:hypothetical protein
VEEVVKASGVLLSGFLLFPALLLGCTSMKVISLSDHTFPQMRHATDVDVYEHIGEVPEPHEKIAVLEVSSTVTKMRMVHDSQRRAAELGGSGIVLERIGKHTETNLLFIGNVFIPVLDERWDGRVIVIRVN